jgi:hypothetical protein
MVVRQRKTAADKAKQNTVSEVLRVELEWIFQRTGWRLGNWLLTEKNEKLNCALRV